ncbi:MAG: ATP-dependent helicase [Planctomycetota bacterium]|nr:MAG: ATP-dependent helicase [Planctomycetota bacterium]REJ86926.1 MAG: ATP-dependent helicase [Planctomycetota bacterium]REK24947.1 MAG: ATP-dependent helicase [Planctomycetota bacterium]REK48536.1 MAG: ATP-dependent helicase [Planctomycetota bacterium]
MACDTALYAADISTIHSFLFRNLVRPYLHLLKDESGDDLVAHDLVTTHNEHYVRYDHLKEWLEEYGEGKLRNPFAADKLQYLKKRLREQTVSIGADGHACYVSLEKSDGRENSISHLLSPDRLLSYNRRRWPKGTIDHDDVLYFAHRLLREHSPLRGFLSARFPYLFIDEFQDTSPVQAELVRLLASEGTVVGVIGDPEQAIFGFLGAEPKHFEEFGLDGHRCYRIDDNRRSTAAIVSLVNHVRSDQLTQKAKRGEKGKTPVVYFGDLAESLAHVRATSKHADSMLVLARTHRHVRQARQSGKMPGKDPSSDIARDDPDRFRFIKTIAVATDLAQRGFPDLAIQHLLQQTSSRSGFYKPLIYSVSDTPIERRSLAVSLLEYMVTHNAKLNRTH